MFCQFCSIFHIFGWWRVAGGGWRVAGEERLEGVQKFTVL
jgi:hypothetical protein